MSSHRSRDPSPHSEIHNTPGAFPPSPKSEPDHGVVSAPQSLSFAVKARRSEYIRKKTIKVKVGTWNVAALSGTDRDIGAWFVEGKGVKGLDENLSGEPTKDQKDPGNDEENIESVEDQELRTAKKKSTLPTNDVPAVAAGEKIGLYILGLQEIVDITSASEALRPFADPTLGKKWKAALNDALPQGYKNVAEQQMSGLYLLIYASPEVAASISSVSSTSVGTGLMGYMRNKGAVCARFVLGETTRLVFVNCHLAAGSDKAALDRRNWDVGQILSRIRFDPMTDSAEVVEEFGDAIGDEDFAFWFGDLNYRLDDIPPEDVRRLLLLHTRNEYDLNNKSKRKIDGELGYISADRNSSPTDADHDSQNSKDSMDSSDNEVDGIPLDPESDPASLHTTLQSLLSHDQLRNQQRAHKAFHDGWREGDINFLPTYKYDVGSVGMFDSGDKKRGPSWCDRILYRTRQDRVEAEKKREQEDEAQKRDDEMKKRGLDESDEDVLFDSDPGTPGFPGTPGYAPGDYYDEEEDAATALELEPDRNGIDEAIALEHYGSHQRVLSSDHKPLDAVFRITYEAVMPELKAKVHQEVARELDKQENEGRPGVTVVVDNQPEASRDKTDASAEQNECKGINFGEVRYGVPKSAGLTVANTGGVSATFTFIDRPIGDGQKTGIAPSWLHLEVEGESDNSNSNRNALQEYTLSPGETRYVQLSVDVQEFKLVRKLNEGKMLLDDVLVLRVKEGRDHFIPVSGSWMQSSFCRTLEELVLVPEGGIQQMQRDSTERVANTNGHKDHHEPIKRHRLSAPRELFALTETVQDLAQKAVAEWEMMHTDGTSHPPWQQEPHGNGWPFQTESWTLHSSQERSQLLAAAREALDTGAQLCSHFPDEASTLHRLEVLAEILVTFLKSLQNGIITTELWAQLDSHMNTTGKSGSSESDPQSWILEILSSAPLHNVSFTFITFMLSRMANEIAPLSNPSNPPQSPRASSSSTSSSNTDSQPQQQIPSSTSASPSPTSHTSPPTTSAPRPPSSSLFSSFRRTRAGTSTSSASAEDYPPTLSPTTKTTTISVNVARRQALEHAYADIFVEAMIRRPPSMKDRKATRERMRRVVLPFMGVGV
jgi:inositol polyphosphate 5-phosphatase INPP5B/F